MNTHNLIDSTTHRALWLAKLHSMVQDCQKLETAISVTMLAYPGAENALALISADSHLGQAVASLTEVSNRIARLKQ